MIFMMLDATVRVLDPQSFYNLPESYRNSHKWSINEDACPQFPIYIVVLDSEEIAAPAKSYQVQSQDWEFIGLVPVFYFYLDICKRDYDEYSLYIRGDKYEIRDAKGKRYLVSRNRQRNSFDYTFDGDRYFNV